MVVNFIQVTAWGIPVLLSVGVGLMFAPLSWGRWTACVFIATAGVWVAVAIYRLAQCTSRRSAIRRLMPVGAYAVDAVLTVVLIWFALARADAQLPPAAGASSAVTITGGDNVVSVGQIGGITARVVTINPPMQPEFRILDKKDIANPDGTHTIIITGSVASPITPGLLTLQIQAPGMRAANIMAAPVDGISLNNLRNVRQKADFYSVEIPSPRGQYVITVVTAGAAEVKLDASF